MPFPSLDKYLARLNATQQPDARVWLDAEGRAQGKYFNSTLTSAFQPVRGADGAIAGYEGFARSYSGNDAGLSLWKLLDHAASDTESIELDRLCRVLHTVNFYRQPEAAGLDLYLNIHARLLAAVDSNHGIAFRRILSLLELPHERIVLQLPAAAPAQAQRGWLLDYVLDNYRRNGFRLAVGTADASAALALLERARPQVVKLDGRQLIEQTLLDRLLARAAEFGVAVAFKRIEDRKVADLIVAAAARHGAHVLLQGFLWDTPAAALRPPAGGVAAAA